MEKLLIKRLGESPLYTEKEVWYIHGILGVLIEIILFFLIVLNISYDEKGFVILFSTVFIVILTGFTNNSMHEAKRVLFFGKYLGTLRHQGLVVTVPFTNRKKVSLQMTSYVTTLSFAENHLNDEYKIFVFYRIVDTAKANLTKGEIEHLISLYSEVIIRSMLKQNPDFIEQLDGETDIFTFSLNEKVKSFGIEAHEAYVYKT